MLRSHPGKTMSRDSVSNFIVSLTNAAAIGKDRVTLPFTSHVNNIALALERLGYLSSVEKKGKKIPELVVTLSFEKGMPKVRGARRVSKPSRRLYTEASRIRPIRSGAGISVLTTTKGILSGKEARDAKVGGEILFELW